MRFNLNKAYYTGISLFAFTALMFGFQNCKQTNFTDLSSSAQSPMATYTPIDEVISCDESKRPATSESVYCPAPNNSVKNAFQNFEISCSSTGEWVRISKNLDITNCPLNNCSKAVNPGLEKDRGACPVGASGRIYQTCSLTCSGTTYSQVNCSQDNYTRCDCGPNAVFNSSTLSCIRSVDAVFDPIVFKTLRNVDPGIVITSETVTVTGLEPNYEFKIRTHNVHQFIDAGTNALSGSFVNSKTVKTSPTGTFKLAARLTSNGWGAMMPLAGISINNKSAASWEVYSRNVDIDGTIDNQFGVVNSAQINKEYTSDTVTVSGLEPNFTFTIGARSSTGNGQIDAGTYGLSGQFSYQWVEVKTSPTGTLKVAFKATAPSLKSTLNEISLILRFNDPNPVPGPTYKIITAP